MILPTDRLHHQSQTPAAASRDSRRDDPAQGQEQSTSPPRRIRSCAWKRRGSPRISRPRPRPQLTSLAAPDHTASAEPAPTRRQQTWATPVADMPIAEHGQPAPRRSCVPHSCPAPKWPESAQPRASSMPRADDSSSARKRPYTRSRPLRSAASDQHPREGHVHVDRVPKLAASTSRRSGGMHGPSAGAPARYHRRSCMCPSAPESTTSNRLGEPMCAYCDGNRETSGGWCACSRMEYLSAPKDDNVIPDVP